MADRVGQRLGNYHLLRLLGKGGYAEVYLGQHRYLKTESAIKIFPLFLTEEDRHAFLSEAQVMARLIHPHIVRILDSSIEHGIPFLVMDYAPNGTLRDVHPAGEQLSPATVLGYVKDVANALHYAHQEHLIHRDIKPGNLLLGRHVEVLLSDFGLAVGTQRSHTQPRSEVAGTVAYMAPEQIEGRPCPPSDQYSLGVVVFEWLTGAWPFQGTVRDIVAQHLMHEPPSLRDKAPHISPAVEQVVLRALAKKPEERFESVLEFANALEQAIKPRPSRSPQRLTLPQTQPKVTPDLLPNHLDRSRPDDLAGLTPEQLLAAQPSKSPQERLAEKVRERSTPQQETPPHPETSPTAPAPPETYHPGRSGGKHPPAEEKLAVGTTLLTYREHTSAVTALAWSPGGGRVASGSWDCSVHVWEATTSSRLLRYQGHTAGITALAWSPDKKFVASGSDDGLVQIWNPSTGQTRFTYTGHTQAITALAWSADSSYLASASTDLTVHVWKPLQQVKPFIYKGHRSLVEVIMWAPDKKRITTVGRDQSVQRWDAVSGANVLRSHNPDAPARASAWSADGERLASGNEDGLVILKEEPSGRLLMVYRGHIQKVLVVAWSPDGRRVASGSADQTVHIWQAR
ncbi:MAG TPA: protein kinase [Ktedonobacterales bacterium]|nr:protein kinase [Ktedonobacterales bacterium]